MSHWALFGKGFEAVSCGFGRQRLPRTTLSERIAFEIPEQVYHWLSGLIRANRVNSRDSHDSHESGDSRESEIQVIRANWPDAL